MCATHEERLLIVVSTEVAPHLLVAHRRARAPYLSYNSHGAGP